MNNDPNNLLQTQKEFKQTISRFADKKISLADAEKYFDQFRGSKSSYFSANSNHMLGLIALENNNFEKAAVLIRKALNIHPDSWLFHHNLAGVLRALGNFVESREHYERSIQIKPRYAEAYFNLFDSQKFSDGHELQESLEIQLNQIESFSTEDQCFLHFAAAKLYDDQKQFDLAFEQMKLGNARRNMQFDTEAFGEFINRIIKATPANLFAQRSGTGLPEARPIFIVGMPRSGTTLIESVLASHSGVLGLGERNDVIWIAGTIDKHPKIPGGYPEALAHTPDVALQQLAEQYFSRTSESNPHLRTVDKMPVNHQHIGLINLLFPGARIINCRRDPRDICLSCYSKRFRLEHAYAYDLKHLAHFYHGYDRLMKHWHSVSPNPILDVQYEDFVANQERTTRQLLEFCDLPWEDSCVEFNKSQRAIRTASNWQARQKLYHSSIARWRNYEQHLSPLIEELDRLGVLP